ncbi:hypothetical protein [Halopseudomonas formosensis]|uniref:SMI1/KNR4 family protein n=1 Tax=Halopseudomonas formosensis TaxID=1002526 RepID=A0ABU5BZ77_9GAMM|nr:hypothetical protein [Halopseudomonas formosensis]MDX9688078.1 hypothetical protein [Halopseudomonas formosensis]
MSEISNFIQFKHDDKNVVEKLKRVFSGGYNGSNEELESLFYTINPEITELINQTNNGHKNLDWLDPFPELKQSANHLLNFDELEEDYRLWLGDTKFYDEALIETGFDDHGQYYEIYAGWNGYIGAFLIRLLSLTGAYDISFKQDSVDWDA